MEVEYINLTLEHGRLAEILGDPSVAKADEARQVLDQVARVTPVLRERERERERLIDVEEAAELIKRPARWIRARYRRLAFCRGEGKDLRCLLSEVEEFARSNSR